MDYIDEIDFDGDNYADIVAKDGRYHPRAYAVLQYVLSFLSGPDGEKHFSGEDVLTQFKEDMLDQYGPLAYSVLKEWGVNCTEDIGEMMFNLVEGHRIGKDRDDGHESFLNGYDFKETFFDIYQT